MKCSSQPCLLEEKEDAMLDQNSNVPVQPSIPLSPPPKLWTARTIGLITFLLGFPAGIVLASINWMRINMKKKAILYLVGGLAGIIILTIISIFLPSSWGRIFTFVVNLGFVFFLYNQVKTDIENFKSSNNSIEDASQLNGCLIGLGVLVLYLAMVYGIGFFVGIVFYILGIPFPQ